MSQPVDTSVLDAAHRYWFGDNLTADGFPADKAKIWFQPTAEIDDHIRKTFGAAILPARGEWNISALSPKQQVGLVVLLDQFPRNIHRDSAEAFASDAAARRVADAVLAYGETGGLSIAERSFLVLPFEHSESAEDQDRAVFLAAQLAVAAPPTAKDYARSLLDYATRHRDLIRRFGRFPHRNAWLGRASTDEEEKFLKEKGRGY